MYAELAAFTIIFEQPRSITNKPESHENNANHDSLFCFFFQSLYDYSPIFITKYTQQNIYYDN